MRAMSILEDRGSFEEKGERTRIPGGGECGRSALFSKPLWRRAGQIDASMKELQAQSMCWLSIHTFKVLEKYSRKLRL